MLTLTEGQFGAAVADALQTMTHCDRSSLHDAAHGPSQTLANRDFVAVASWRRNDRDLDKVDEACFAVGVRWCPVYLSEDRLVCGPLIIPSSGPCFSCFRRRYLCHHPAPERELCLQRAYDRDQSLGPPGFVAPMAHIAASLLLMSAQSGEDARGKLLEINLFDAGLLETQVIAVHNCPRCRRRVEAQTGDRFVNRLKPSVERILA